MVVVLGLLSAIVWGVGDFGAGYLGRRLPVVGILLGSQLAGALLALLLAIVVGEAIPSNADLGWALVSSIFGSLGLATLYIGLSRGQMSVVAPLTGVLAAAIPAVAGIALQGIPAASVIAGILIAIVSVVVVSRIGSTGGRASGFGWGLAAGISLGLLAVSLGRISPGVVFGPLAIMRVAEAAIIVVLVLAIRRRAEVPIRIAPRQWPAVAGVGALDMLGTGAYVAAAQAGPLAIAGVLSALYPVTTVVLAMAILREPVLRWHLAGIALAATAIILITAGS